MRILSLFDGLSGAYIALQRAGIKIDEYYASEIDKYATAISKYNFPDIKRLGDVRDIKASQLPKIDLVIGGSPCTSFSIAGKRDGFKGKSGLFWEFARLVKECKPKYFLLENVASMKKEWRDIISKELEVESIMINSSLLSAQNRKRLYFTNIPNITQPKDRGIILQDILEDNVEDKYFLSKEQLDRAIYYKGAKSTPREKNGFKYFFKEGAMSLTNEYKKSLPLLASGSGSISRSSNLVKVDQIVESKTDIRKITPTECEALQTIPKNFTKKGIINNKEINISNTQRYKALGNGFTIDVIAHILKELNTFCIKK